ncbi:hypothetical protein CMI37_29515 [Candidatus Pacearchaeota archaeon]|nr:hypothetical protein [Candidatus Pacearchaeota archaeon]
MPTFEPIDHSKSIAVDLDDNKILNIYCPDIMAGSTDKLRDAFGNYWQKITDDDGNVEIEPHLLEIENEIEDLRGRYVSRMDTISDYIEKIEINPYKITPISSDVLIPNYKIPMRLYANEETTRGDKFWQTLFVGGSFGTTTYPSLINDTTIFYDEAFRYQIPYSQMETKYMETTETTEDIYQITYDYNFYDSRVRKYQEWTLGLESELLIPNWEIMRIMSYLTYFGESFTDEDELNAALERLDFIVPYYELGVKAALFEEYGTSTTMDTDGTIIDLWTTEDRAISAEVRDGIATFLWSLGNSAARELFLDLIEKISENFSRLTGTQKNTIIERQKNIILDNQYFVDGLMGEDENEDVANLPYYMIINFPRQEGGSADLSLYDSTNTKYYIRDSIAENNFSAKFLEILKDVHNKDFPTVEFGTKSFETTLAYMSGSSAEETKEISDNTNTSFRVLDFPLFLTETYNQYSGSLNSNYVFGGKYSEAHNTTYSDTDLYRFYDNQNVLTVINDVVDLMSTWMDISYDPGTLESVSDAVADESTPAYELLQALFNPSYNHTETLAYRIEKVGGMSAGDQTTTKVLQNYWIFNSAYAPDNLTLYDSQVKYGETYTYNCYAYVLVLAHRYKYGDFRLTQQIGTIDIDAGEEGPEYYCLQFYDPKTNDFADQIFFNGAGLEPGYTDDILTSALAMGIPEIAESANEHATSMQELSKHPHLAECHLYLEPCLKLLEIPLFSKTLKILDNPGNDMITIPFQYLDASQQIGFNTIYESFLKEPYPAIVTDADVTLRKDYLHARDLFETDDIVFQSESPPRYVEVYRMDEPPTALTDFNTNLRQTIDLLIEDSEYTYSQTIVNDVLQTNKKYYYLFRFLSENKIPGHLSQILECELVDDGGYIYSKFNTLEDSDLETDIFINPSIKFKKIIQLQPHVAQLTLDTSGVDYQNTATQELNNLQIGIVDEPVWEKTFKLRLTSQKTGQQLDLNVTFNIKEEDRWASPT